jgi:hypothetical protein
MKPSLWRLLTLVILCGLLAASLSTAWQGARGQGEQLLFLPLLMKGTSAELLPRIHAPNFGNQPIPFGQTAIAWFGQLSADTNYTDIRV